ncbi:MAG: hypothetical protein GY754_28245 [bacterium]|nr:hypothetical protein [bacterium]
MKRVKKPACIAVLLLLSFLFIFVRCYDLDGECTYKPDDCVETAYTQGSLNISVTAKDGVTLSVAVYSGSIDVSNLGSYTPIQTLSVSSGSTSLTLSTGSYSAVVQYNIDGTTVTAVDGGEISDDTTTYCDGTCHELSNGDIDLQLDEEALSAYLGGEGDYCFIATAAYGSSLAGDVRVLKKFRDEYLLTNSAGKWFVNFYYKNSPPLAQFISGNETLRFIVRCLLTPVVFAIKHPFFFLGFLSFLIYCYIYIRKSRGKVIGIR